MKKLSGKLICLALCLTFLAGVSPVNGAPAVRNLKIGLTYGAAAVTSANLQNFSGSGYRFGTFDASGNFTAFAQTGATKLTILRDETTTVGGNQIGAYHIETRTYPSFDGAKAAADLLKARNIPAFPAYAAGSYRVRAEHYSTSEYASAGITALGLGGVVVGNSGTCFTVADTGTGEILFEYDPGASGSFGVMPVNGGGLPVTWYKGYKYGGGFEYIKPSGGNITVVNVIDPQEYARGVIPYEMNPSWHIEALKAQAVCAKTFALANLGKHKDMGFDICNGVDCQVYQGLNSATDNSDRAVRETDGCFIYYGGAPAQTFYHSSNGGATESSLNVWGTDLPYLVPVADNNEDLDSAQYGRWKYEVSASELTQILSLKGISTSGIVNAYVETFTNAGNVLKLTFVDSGGRRYSVERERCRTLLNNTPYNVATRSQRFVIYPKGSAISIPAFGGGSSGAQASQSPAAPLSPDSGSGQLYTNSSGQLYINNSENGITYSSGKLYAIGADGVIRSLTGDLPSLSIITGKSANTGGVSDPASSSAPSSAPSGTVFVIEGRGWGHNVGMSQWGAKGMAERGQTFEQIINFYYTGVQIVR